MIAVATVTIAGVVLAGGAAFASTGLPETGRVGSSTDIAAPTPVPTDDSTSDRPQAKKNGRSQDVAAMPRDAAKDASKVKGAATGKRVSEWAKTHANKKAHKPKKAKKVAEAPKDSVSPSSPPIVPEHGNGNPNGKTNGNGKIKSDSD